IGNMLLERSQHFGYLETLLQQHYPDHELTVRNLGWPADTATLQPRPDNFADTEQHLFHERADVILVAFGFNESFRGGGGLLGFTAATGNYIAKLQSLAFNGKGSPRIVVLSPIANEDIEGVKASKNNPSIKMYADALQTLAEDLQVGYVDLFEPTARAMKSPGNDLTINGVHLNDAGYQFVSDIIFRTLTAEDPPAPREDIRRVVIDKNRQYFRRFRPLNTFITPVGGARRTATWTFFRR
ncbi:MAG: SGNH/GDSL hydrolase family protein, partial [Planctomycetota bacterium]